MAPPAINNLMSGRKFVREVARIMDIEMVESVEIRAAANGCVRVVATLIPTEERAGEILNVVREYRLGDGPEGDETRRDD